MHYHCMHGSRFDVDKLSPHVISVLFKKQSSLVPDEVWCQIMSKIDNLTLVMLALCNKILYEAIRLHLVENTCKRCKTHLKVVGTIIEYNCRFHIVPMQEFDIYFQRLVSSKTIICEPDKIIINIPSIQITKLGKCRSNVDGKILAVSRNRNVRMVCYKQGNNIGCTQCGRKHPWYIKTIGININYKTAHGRGLPQYINISHGNLTFQFIDFRKSFIENKKYYIWDYKPYIPENILENMLSDIYDETGFIDLEKYPKYMPQILEDERDEYHSWMAKLNGLYKDNYHVQDVVQEHQAYDVDTLIDLFAAKLNNNELQPKIERMKKELVNSYFYVHSDSTKTMIDIIDIIDNEVKKRKIMSVEQMQEFSDEYLSRLITYA